MADKTRNGGWNVDNSNRIMTRPLVVEAPAFSLLMKYKSKTFVQVHWSKARRNMIPQPLSIKLARRFAHPAEDVAGSDTSSSDLERNFYPSNGAMKSRLPTRGLTRLGRLKICLLYDPLVLLSCGLLILYVVRYFISFFQVADKSCLGAYV